MRSWTKEFTRFHLTGFCPSCKRFNLVPRLVDSKTDEVLPVMTPIWRFVETTVRVCTKCDARVPVFPSGDVGTQRKQVVGVEISETRISEEPIGSEERFIDNSKSSVGASRSFSVSKEWSRSYIIEREEAHNNSIGSSLGVDEIASFSVRAEESLRSKYSLSDSERQEYAEEVRVDVPAHTRIRIIFHWKRIWQHGWIRLSKGTECEATLPFKIVKGLTFDQSQQDEMG